MDRCGIKEIKPRIGSRRYDFELVSDYDTEAMKGLGLGQPLAQTEAHKRAQKGL